MSHIFLSSAETISSAFNTKNKITITDEEINEAVEAWLKYCKNRLTQVNGNFPLNLNFSVAVSRKIQFASSWQLLFLE